MRIGFDITPLCVPQSGIGTYTTSLLDELVQLQDEIVPLSHRPLTHGKAQASNGHLPYFRLNKTVWMQAILPQQLGRLGLDVCHFTNNVGPILTPCPTVITIHDMTLWLFP